MSMGDGVHMKGFVAADNEISGLALKENHRADNYEVDSTTYVDSVVIGHSGLSFILCPNNIFVNSVICNKPVIT